MAVVRGPLFSVEAWGSVGKTVTFRREQRDKPAGGPMSATDPDRLQRVSTGRGVVTAYKPTAPLVPFTVAPNIAPDGVGGAQGIQDQVPRTQRNQRLYKFVVDAIQKLVLTTWETSARIHNNDIKDGFYEFQSANIRRQSLPLSRRYIRADINTGFYYRGVRSIEEWAFKRLAGNGFGFLWWISNEWMRLPAGTRRAWRPVNWFFRRAVITDTANPFGFDWGPEFQNAWLSEAFMVQQIQPGTNWYYGRGRGDVIRRVNRRNEITIVSNIYRPDPDIVPNWTRQFTRRFQFPFLPE